MVPTSDSTNNVNWIAYAKEEEELCCQYLQDRRAEIEQEIHDVNSQIVTCTQQVKGEYVETVVKSLREKVARDRALLERAESVEGRMIQLFERANDVIIHLFQLGEPSTQVSSTSALEIHEILGSLERSNPTGGNRRLTNDRRGALTRPLVSPLGSPLPGRNQRTGASLDKAKSQNEPQDVSSTAPDPSQSPPQPPPTSPKGPPGSAPPTNDLEHPNEGEASHERSPQQSPTGSTEPGDSVSSSGSTVKPPKRPSRLFANPPHTPKKHKILEQESVSAMDSIAYAKVTLDSIKKAVQSFEEMYTTDEKSARGDALNARSERDQALDASKKAQEDKQKAEAQLRQKTKLAEEGTRAQYRVEEEIGKKRELEKRLAATEGERDKAIRESRKSTLAFDHCLKTANRVGEKHNTVLFELNKEREEIERLNKLYQSQQKRVQELENSSKAQETAEPGPENNLSNSGEPSTTSNSQAQNEALNNEINSLRNREKSCGEELDACRNNPPWTPQSFAYAAWLFRGCQLVVWILLIFGLHYRWPQLPMHLGFSIVYGLWPMLLLESVFIFWFDRSAIIRLLNLYGLVPPSLGPIIQRFIPGGG